MFVKRLTCLSPVRVASKSRVNLQTGRILNACYPFQAIWTGQNSTDMIHEEHEGTQRLWLCLRELREQRLLRPTGGFALASFDCAAHNAASLSTTRGTTDTG